jgi:Tfp pilus assembly pilus retraction ATPase PilT
MPSIMQTGQQYGMQTLDQVLKDLVMKRIITKEEALSRTTNPDLFEDAKNIKPVARPVTQTGIGGTTGGIKR